MFLNLYCINNAFNKSSLSIEREKGMDLTLLCFGHGYTARALTPYLINRGWKVFGTTRSKDKFSDKYVLLRWKLDRKNLPAPLLLTTFFSKAWNFNTGWIVIDKL